MDAVRSSFMSWFLRWPLLTGRQSHDTFYKQPDRGLKAGSENASGGYVSWVRLHFLFQRDFFFSF